MPRAKRETEGAEAEPPPPDVLVAMARAESEKASWLLASAEGREPEAWNVAMEPLLQESRRALRRALALLEGL